MKKLILGLLLCITAIVLACNDSDAVNQDYDLLVHTSFRDISGNDVTLSGMHYKILMVRGGDTAPFVINITKDSLEVALLKKSLK